MFHLPSFSLLLQLRVADTTLELKIIHFHQVQLPTLNLHPQPNLTLQPFQTSAIYYNLSSRTNLPDKE
jgi:hypothetical protein